ncbi:MAG: chemotaxis protein CheW [Desulfobacterales bacterium]|nr:chemotaxis protein CheW [Desulfobacterales bacterium]
MMFEDDETLRMYVEECLEHLSEIENDLLAIEEAGANSDEEIVNNVFRAAHSIKGGAGFMGLTTIKELAHNLENVLGLIRSKELVPDSEIISVLLRSFDQLRELISNIETSNDIDVSQHINSLIQVTTSSLSKDEKGSLSQKVKISFFNGRVNFELSKFDVDQCKKQGKFIYLVEQDLIDDIHRKGKTPLGVMKSLVNSGIILDSRIDVDSVGTIEDSIPTKIPFLILFASIIGPDIIPALFDVDSSVVHLVSDDMIRLCDESEIDQLDTLIASTLDEPSIPIPDDKDGVPQEEIEIPQKVEANFQDIGSLTDEKPIHEIEKPIIKEAIKAAPQKVVKPVTTKPKEEKPHKPIERSIKPIEPEDDEDKRGDSKTGKGQTTLRVNVNLLDTLMTLAGELVLSRNQLIQAINANNKRATEVSGQRIDMITSELQEAIMRTRMQPIANVLTKFTRVVRDLSRDLGKRVDLTIEGKEVELDKTIIESINDPLTHLVRNAVDHGIEPPDVRQLNGKSATGIVKLKAYHEAGQVNIEISDDGKGIDPQLLGSLAIKKGLLTEQQVSTMSDKDKYSIILLPGFSTASKITDVSGRGVGMDVVKTNLDKLGGIIDISSVIGKGTMFRIKLPLTLAIIPSQIISVGKERFAIPQVNLDELLRIPAAQVKERIEQVGDAEVVRLRGNLLPLVNLADVMDIERVYVHPNDEQEYPDRRKAIVDRRSRKKSSYNEPVESKNKDDQSKKRRSEDRRFHAQSAINIAVVSAGNYKYGLVVDQLSDSEEIVVKPLGRHLKECSGYAGATIMGDGRVALILDIASIAQMAQLTASSRTDKKLETTISTDTASLLLFRNAETEQFAAPLNLVERIERVTDTDIEQVGIKKVVQYRGGTLPLFELSEVAKVQQLPKRKLIEVIVFKISGKEVGLMVTPPVDAVEVTLNIDDVTLKQPGIMGSMIIGNKTTQMVDMHEVVRTLNPAWFIQQPEPETNISPKLKKKQEMKRVLFAEDSAFFRNQVKAFIEDGGYIVNAVEDGQEAWDYLQEHVEDIGMVLTDLEMPEMDGFELTRRIKADKRFIHLKVIALTSLAGNADIEKGRAAGIDEYQVKLDKENLLKLIKEHMVR